MPPRAYESVQRLTTDPTVDRVTASSDATVAFDVWMIRPTAGDGDIASIQGQLAWDPGVLTFVSSTVVESGWTWVANDANVSTGTLTYAAFSATGSSNTFVLARITFSASGTAGGATSLELSVTAAGDAVGTNILALIRPVSPKVIVE